jgi:hypothetical protein
MMCVFIRLSPALLLNRCRSILIGELDEAIDQSTDLSTIRAEPLPPIRY